MIVQQQRRMAAERDVGACACARTPELDERARLAVAAR